MGSVPISDITATGVLGEFDYHVDFLNEDSNQFLQVIYAENGRGKTNLLRGISHLTNLSLSAIESLVESPIEYLDIQLKDGCKVSLRRRDAFSGPVEIEISIPNSVIEEIELANGRSPSLFQDDDGIPPRVVSFQVQASDFTGRMYRRAIRETPEFTALIQHYKYFRGTSVFIPDSRLSVSPDTLQDAEIRTRNSPSVRVVGAIPELLEQAEQALSRLAFSGLARADRSEGVYAEITRRTLKSGRDNMLATDARALLERKIAEILENGAQLEKYGVLTLKQIRAIDKEISAARRNNSNFSYLYPVLSPYLNEISAQIETLQPSVRTINTFVSSINGFLDMKSLHYSTQAGISLKTLSGIVLDPEALSSGERHLLYLMCQALTAMEESHLVIIDEPELSLGLKWQRILLQELLRCTEGSGVQFLVASHSTQIMRRVPTAEIVRPFGGRQ